MLMARKALEHVGVMAGLADLLALLRRKRIVVDLVT